MILTARIIADLKSAGVDTFFGVQGGAAARFIDEIVKHSCKFVPVLNEQAAAYCAHGYYFATKKPAGVVVTTGPGLTNAISGIASCYYDSVPLALLIGQVSRSLNTASDYEVKMVGFQEVPHLKLVEPISDYTLQVNDVDAYIENRGFLVEQLMHQRKVVAIEVNDDVQRLATENVADIKVIGTEPEYKLQPERISVDLFVVGAGASDLNDQAITTINDCGVPVVTSWGAQHLSWKFSSFSGIFGTHTPGIANELIKASKCPIVLGASLLQHQVGKDPVKFLPSASRIIFVNESPNECDRAADFFGERLEPRVVRCQGFTSNVHFDSPAGWKFPEVSVANGKIIDGPPLALRWIFEAFSRLGRIVFLDAGATLSWSYQAANLGDPLGLEFFTAFNLHPMGWANCAQLGASCGAPNQPIMAVIGDGSLPMNVQELAAFRSCDKLIVVDNQGYGIIRQTQKQFYDSNFAGSSFDHPYSPLPKFSVTRVLGSFFKDENIRVVDENDMSKLVSEEFIHSQEQVLVLRVSRHHEVTTDFYE